MRGRSLTLPNFYSHFNKEIPSNAFFCLFCFCVVVMALLVYYSTSDFVFDEKYYIEIVKNLLAYGLSIEFLDYFPGPTGLLYVFVHAILAPLTHLVAPAIRFVNITGLFIIILLLFFTFRRLKLSNPTLASLSILSVPMIWPISGMALTEIPAMSFLTFSLFLISCTLAAGTVTSKFREGDRPPQDLLTHAAAGLAIGMAAIGRQPYIVVVLSAAPIFYFYGFWNLKQSLVFLVCGLLLPVSLFAYWGGLTPQQTSFVRTGLAVDHLIFSIGYAALTMFILSPRWFNVNPIILLASFLFGFLFNSTIFHVNFMPMHTIALSVFGRTYGESFSVFCGGLYVGISIIFLVSLVKNCIGHLGNAFYMFCSISCLLIVIHPIMITHVFASRYTAMATPFFVFLSSYREDKSILRLACMVLGALLGIASLSTYLNYIN